MIIFDEVGQLSSQEFSLLDLILRQIRQNDMPFGGVLIIGSFDHMQINSIDGLPFLLSSHLLTDYTIVKLEHSVRAAGDTKLMVSGIIMISHLYLYHAVNVIYLELLRNRGYNK